MSVKKEIPRAYCARTREAARLLGAQIKLVRKQRNNWSEKELSERVGFSRYTLQRIEKGDLTVSIGLFFEAATIVGIELFEKASEHLPNLASLASLHGALIPQVRKKPTSEFDDDF